MSKQTVYKDFPYTPSVDKTSYEKRKVADSTPIVVAFGVWKYNISEIPGNLGTNILVYFPQSNEISV